MIIAEMVEIAEEVIVIAEGTTEVESLNLIWARLINVMKNIKGLLNFHHTQAWEEDLHKVGKIDFP